MLRHQTTGRRFLGLALASCAVVQWGTQPVVLKILVQSLDVFTLAWMRFVATAVLLFPLAIRRGGLAVLLRLRGRQLLLLGVAVFGLLANYLTYMAGLAYVTPGTAQMVNQLAPMLMLLGSLWIYGEPFGRLQWVGLAVLVVGLGLFLREAQPCLGELRARAHDRLLIIERVDLDEHIIQLEEAALGERGGDPRDPAGDLRDELALGAWPHRPLARHAERHVSQGDHVHAHARRCDDQGLDLHRRAAEDHREGRKTGDAEHRQRPPYFQGSNKYPIHGRYPFLPICPECPALRTPARPT